MKRIILILIAIFAICTLVAEINNITFSIQIGSNRSYLVYGYGRKTTIPPASVPAVNVGVEVIFTGPGKPELSTYEYTDHNGFYYIDAREYYPIPPGYTHARVVVDGFFIQTVPWNYDPVRVDFLIDQAF